MEEQERQAIECKGERDTNWSNINTSEAMKSCCWEKGDNPGHRKRRTAHWQQVFVREGLQGDKESSEPLEENKEEEEEEEDLT